MHARSLTVDGRFDQVDARFDRRKGRFGRLERKIDQFSDVQLAANELTERRLERLAGERRR